MISSKVSGVGKSVRVLESRLKSIRMGLAKAVLETAYDIESETKQNTRVDTGRARASVHVEGFGMLTFSYTAAGNTYTGGFTKKAKDPYEAYVGSNVEYFVFLENGTYNRAGDHMLRNATRANMPKLRENVKKILR